MIEYDPEEFKEVCNSSDSMAQAASKLKLHFNTFKRIALKLECYNPNQSGKGMRKRKKLVYKTSDILKGKHPHYQTFKLKKRLLKEKILENKCSICYIIEQQGKEINCELDHIDGDRTNHRLKNLRILCPNCHSQTETFRAKNIKSDH